MRSYKQSKNRGFTLVELMIVVAIIGILAALAIFGVRRYLASAKTSEAKNNVGAIARGAVAAYERETASNQMLADSAISTPMQNVLCLSATAAPALVPAAKKTQPSSADGADFNSGDSVTGWKCLRFSMTQPVYYQYAYGAGNAGGATGYTYGSAGGTALGFEAIAVGDLDGNGVYANFARGADVKNGQVKLSTQIYVKNEYE